MKLLTTRRIFAAVGPASLALLAVACGSSSTSAPAVSAPSTSAPAASASAPAASGSSAAPAAATAVLKTDTTKLGTVLTNAKGFTVYWFAKDTSTSSTCAGACAAAWPPVIGMPQAASGVKLAGKLGEIQRSNGTMQATYDGHPLYLFAGDSAPGQANGNGINGFGALWYAIKIGASTTASTGVSGTSGNSGNSGTAGSGDMGENSGTSGTSGTAGSGDMGGSSGGSGGW